jgi:hypothetical protein
VARKNALFYRVSANGAAGDWYWEVISDRNVIARGLAPTGGTSPRGRPECRHMPHRTAVGRPLAISRGRLSIIELRRSLGGLSWSTLQPKLMGRTACSRRCLPIHSRFLHGT